MLLFDPNLLRFSTQHDPILDPKLAPINPSCALLFPITFPTRFPTSFWTGFGPKLIPKSIKNQSDISSTIKLQTSPSSASSSIKFRRQSHVQAKWSMFKNRSKTLCFCMFLRHPLMPTKANTRHATHSKIIKNHIHNQWIFHRNYMNFRSFLASISKSEIWTSWGRSWARFWPRFPTMLGSKTTSERHQKIITKKDANMSPTWTPTWPQEASQNGLMNRRRGGVMVQDSLFDRSYA